MRTLFVSLAMLMLTSPALAQQSTSASRQGTAGSSNPSMTTNMQDAKGQPVGTVTLKQLAHGLVLVVNLRNLPPGPHGFHLHERGQCDAPDFKSAGGRFNPHNATHGFASPQGPPPVTCPISTSHSRARQRPSS